MPLIILTGVPCSGKTTRAKELKKFFEEQGKEVHILSEFEKLVQANFEKNALYSDSNKEKHIRGLLKSEMIKRVTPNNVVILDGLNYIKGYRYELFCATKANKSTQCTLYTIINFDEAWTLNENRENDEKYTRNIFDELVMRFEEPDAKNRWDAPLFTVLPDSELNTSEIFTSLFKKKPPKPNMSTENQPLCDASFLYELDQITKKIVDDILNAKESGKDGVVTIPGYDHLTIDISKVNIEQLTILRRQYITFSKMHTPDPKKIPDLFVQYLTTTLK